MAKQTNVVDFEYKLASNKNLRVFLAKPRGRVANYSTFWRKLVTSHMLGMGFGRVKKKWHMHAHEF